MNDDEPLLIIDAHGKEWRFVDHPLGPVFLRQDGEPMKRIPNKYNVVWDAIRYWRATGREIDEVCGVRICQWTR